MDTFGDRLKTERQGRGLTVQDVAESLRVDDDLLRALERNDFDALPDEAVMMDCLQAYAEVLRVDADLMIEDYAQERDRHLRKVQEVVAAQVAEPAPAATPPEAERRLRSSPWLVALFVVATAMLTVWWMLSRDGTAPEPERSVATAPVEPQPLRPTTPDVVAPTPVEQAAAQPAPPPPAQKTPDVVTPTPVEPPAAQPAPPPPAQRLLSITEYGVGAAVENSQLVGQSDRFAEGRKIAFWTRVQGGSRGQRIEHVWLREGVEASRVSLEIGSPSWRTHSIKTLYAGTAGNWAVEARDSAGHVLARSEFVCVP